MQKNKANAKLVFQISGFGFGDNFTMYNEMSAPQFESYQAQLVPYFSWANRGEAEMSVWLPVIW